MAMARAQELQELDWEMENGHGGTTHIFVMTGLLDQCFTHMIGTWPLMVFCRCTVCIVSSQCSIFWNWFWWYSIFYENGLFAC
jgi:hypothetical protein